MNGIYQDKLIAMWRAEYGGEVSPFLESKEDAVEALELLESGAVWRDGGWEETLFCQLCEEKYAESEEISTEDGYRVGPCCEKDLRVERTGDETFCYAF